MTRPTGRPGPGAARRVRQIAAGMSLLGYYHTHAAPGPILGMARRGPRHPFFHTARTKKRILVNFLRNGEGAPVAPYAPDIAGGHGGLNAL